MNLVGVDMLESQFSDPRNQDVEESKCRNLDSLWLYISYFIFGMVLSLSTPRFTSCFDHIWLAKEP